MDVKRRHFMGVSAAGVAGALAMSPNSARAAQPASMLGRDATQYGVKPNSPDDQTRALQRAIHSFKGASRVAMMASGGLSHFVIDEELDQSVLAAMEGRDEESLARLPENVFKVGTAEIKNWVPVSAAMNAEGRRYHQVDYVPCYRSEAGTGNAMAFVYWE